MRFDIFASEDHVRERWSVGGALGAWLHSSAVDFIPTPSPAMYACTQEDIRRRMVGWMMCTVWVSAYTLCSPSMDC